MSWLDFDTRNPGEHVQLGDVFECRAIQYSYTILSLPSKEDDRVFALLMSPRGTSVAWLLGKHAFVSAWSPDYIRTY